MILPRKKNGIFWIHYNKMSFTLRFSTIFLALALLSVIFVASSNFFPYIGVKAYWFRLCVSLALIFFLGWVGFQSSNEEIRRLFKQTFSSPLVLATTIFAVIFVLASVFAYDPLAAFWSNLERGEGGFPRGPSRCARRF